MPEKKAYLQFRTHFSIRQEIYCRLSIVRCWQIPHIFHIRPPETWGCFKTQGTSWTKTLRDLGSTGTNEPNIHSVFCKNIFSDINAISLAINHLGIHLENTFIWEVFINKRGSCESFIYIFMHSEDSVIHVFTHSRGLVSVCVCVCDPRCSPVTVRLVLFPRGLSSFTEP